MTRHQNVAGVRQIRHHHVSIPSFYGKVRPKSSTSNPAISTALRPEAVMRLA
jgi:hypothetical protein